MVAELAASFAALGLSADVEMRDVDADTEMAGVEEVQTAAAWEGEVMSSARKVLGLAEKGASGVLDLEVSMPQVPAVSETRRAKYDEEAKKSDYELFEGLTAMGVLDRKSTRLNSSHSGESRMPSSA